MQQFYLTLTSLFNHECLNKCVNENKLLQPPFKCLFQQQIIKKLV